MDNKNIAQQVQILINQFNAKNFDLVISKGNILLKKNPEYVILYNLIGSENHVLILSENINQILRFAKYSLKHV